jgi:hypothetical protein
VVSRLPAVILPAALISAGCASFRLAGGPTLDTGGKVGATGGFAIGFTMPVDFHGRSHHYLQALASIGGGRDGATGGAMFSPALDLDYIYWAEPRMDVRAGLHLPFEAVPTLTSYNPRFGFGGHAAVLPIVYANGGSWLVTHLCVGPELRGEALSGNPAGGALGLFSLPLVVELNLLPAGD